tara:strand:+ start:273 stop:671 length:399 start_codon:yes stop_codon:yes gene_type:complete
MIETMKWTFYTFFIAIMAMIVVIGVGVYLDREIQSDDIEFILAKNYVENDFLGRGKTTFEELKKISEIQEKDYGLLVKVGEEEQIVKKSIYDYKGLCGIKGSPVVCSGKFTDFYLVDNELKKVEIELVKKVG